MEEIALVLGAIDAAQEPAALTDARVVTGCEALRPEAPGVVEPDSELDLAIAEHVGIRRPSGFELCEEMREHALAVLWRETRLVDRDAEFVGDAPRVLEIVCRRAVTLVVFDPVRHEECFDLVPGIPEEGGRNRGVHATRERDDHTGHGLARDLSQQCDVLRHVTQHLDRVARTAEVIVEAKLDQWTAMLASAGTKLFAVEP